MTRWHRIPYADGGRRIVQALGALYLASAAVWPFTPVGAEPSTGLVVVLGVLVGGPGIVLLYGGYRLRRSDGVRAETFPVVAKWCLAGVGVMLALLGLIALADALRDPLLNVLMLTALGSVAGFAAGLHDARAKSRKLELEETVEHLRTSNERLEEFAYAASHDLQEPLRMVSSYLRLLEDRYGDDLDEEALEFVDFAVDGADRMRAMVESLLEYSRVTTRGEPLEPTDAGAVLEDARDDLQLRIEETDAEITAEDLPTVVADDDQLAQVFRNLLSNALTYSGDDPPRVHVGAERVDGSWRFSVADEGIGIDPDYQERIFTVFEQFQADETGRGAGGIGLALCERIVERHGGDIWVESEPGEGATFYFTLPATDDREGESDRVVDAVPPE